MAKIIQFPQKLKMRDEEYQRKQALLMDAYLSLEALDEAEEMNGNSLLGGMSNMWGNHNSSIRKLFLSFYNAPSAKTWDAIRCYLVDDSTTAWQLWIKFDPKAPKALANEKQKSMFPDPEKFAEYFKEHRKNRRQMLVDKIKEYEEELSKYALTLNF